MGANKLLRESGVFLLSIATGAALTALIYLPVVIFDRFGDGLPLLMSAAFAMAAGAFVANRASNMQSPAASLIVGGIGGLLGFVAVVVVFFIITLSQICSGVEDCRPFD